MSEEAAASDLPAVLVKPWWLEPPKKAKGATTVEGLTPLPYEERLALTEEDREKGAAAARSGRAYFRKYPNIIRDIPADGAPQADFDAVIVRANEERLARYKKVEVCIPGWLDFMSDDAAAGMVRKVFTTTPDPKYADAAYLLGRFGIEVFPSLLENGKDHPEYADAYQRDAAENATLVESPRSAALLAAMAQGTKGKKLQPTMATYFERFPEASAIGVLPLVLAKATQKGALTAFTMLVDDGRDAIVLDVAKRYGDAALAATEELLANVRAPKSPPPMKWFDEAAMPPVLLRANGRHLPASAVRHLATLLGVSDPRRPAPGLADVKAACTPDSLERFAWSLFEAWLASGGDAKEDWAMLALGHLGGDESARKLTALVRAWPGESLHLRAVRALDALAQIGSDVSLMLLDGIAEKLKFKALQEKAREKIELVAKERKLTRDELADRIAPRLDLDDDGARVLSFGPRSFRVGFDEHLAPFVTDETGKKLGDLPKAKATDDAAQAKAATDAWKALKKDAKAVGGNQTARLERAMCTARRWSAADFTSLLVGHPLIVHLARRLLWGTYEGDELRALFRVAEDRTLAGADDEPFTLPSALPSGATVGLVHRLDLDDVVAQRWSQRFAEYELIQPFEQLARATYVVTDGERSAQALDRMKGVEVATGKVIGLEARGWRKGSPKDSGWIWDMVKPLGGDLYAELPIEGGFIVSAMSESPPKQGLGAVRLFRHRHAVELGALTPLAFSELVRDLESLRD
ncbi:MAG: DUF4132 domain-containing protein [Labilithrix sp.]|nr:DUF4132 domain-containing protein [Labilithrix sp.]MCW5816791.1 DUF4132 domain-containing protein [Labilithrix sp.]